MHDVMLNLKLDTRVGLQMGKISKSAQSDQTSTVMEAQRNLFSQIAMVSRQDVLISRLSPYDHHPSPAS